MRPVFVHGDRVVIRWKFRFEWLDGTVTQMEELTYQRWEGERIAEEEICLMQRIPSTPPTSRSGRPHDGDSSWRGQYLAR